MADSLTGMPISTLPEATLQQSDQLIAYREDTGKAYRSNVASIGEATEANISDAFSETKTYAAGDYVIYEDTLYVFTEDKEAGAWDSEAVEKTSVGTEVAKLGDQVTELSSALTYNSGDVLNVNDYRCGGYVTASAASVQFYIPLDKPLASDVGIASSNIQMIIRQNGNYTHGSASGTYVTPSSITFYKQNSFISLACTMSSTTNATNNDACGIQLGNSSTITFGVATTASPQSTDDPDAEIEAGPVEEIEP